ncbi:S1 family peptidase [Catenuloplanes atrovinosus]|uniref:Streptogrisin C n=1 Tax=Catenuloplanes atrovinosus TaxID=137266 RepID=A0AAE3YJ90_9ACTN|nr:S1 family peptidase [Catenuloplanes atrovinosus]MDR7273415.1 streptogrisin C [Catenuloplanes atrovinosus]
MDRRRALTTAVVIATAGAAVALTFPAFAGTGERERPSGDVTADRALAAPEVLAALSRDFGLTTEQATDRLAAEREAAEAVRTVKAAAGAAWAGAWLAENAETLTIAVTDQALADEVRAAGAEPKIVAHSSAVLDQVKSALDTNADEAAESIPGWYVDPSSNTVVVLARADVADAEATAKEFAEASGVDAAAVRVETSEEAPKPLFDVVGGDAYSVGNAGCSIGFSVVGGFVTAGHCGRAGADTRGVNGVAQGEITASSFPGDDFAVVRTNADWTPTASVNNYNGGVLPVAGSEVAPVGASICRSGATTGLHCGEVRALNATVNYAEGTVTGLTRTSVCAEPGDSGGAFIAGDQAQGVTSGGSGDCTRGGVTFFQPVNEILERNNLTLITTGDGGTPPATTPPATPPATTPPAEPSEPPADGGDCAAEGSVARDGTITRPGQRRDVVRFRAPAGTHAACLTAPEGADFDLYLQQQVNGGRWVTVARAATDAGSETLTFEGGAGNYRYRVASASGTGEFELRFAVN